LANQRFDDRVVRVHLSGDILLALEQRGDIALQINNFAGDGLRGARAEQTAANYAGKRRGGE
jgi:hypothetical protein